MTVWGASILMIVLLASSLQCNYHTALLQCAECSGQLPHCISTIVLIAAADSTFSIVTSQLNEIWQTFFLHCQLHNWCWPDQAMVGSSGPELKIQWNQLCIMDTLGPIINVLIIKVSRFSRSVDGTTYNHKNYV